MDWDRIRAKDLLVLFSSFVPKGGAVLSVKVYPSEFGKDRLKMEASQGPQELRALPEDSEDDTEEDRVYREKLRDYQFKRLKYFYAVVQCDSVSTAAKIYEDCDGFEYESSCSVLDLRFIPEDVSFEGEEPKDVATDVNMAAYTPKLFNSSATSTSKVTLTWDETDHDRVSTLNRKFNKDELLDMDFKAYLASSSEEEEEEEEEEEDRRRKDKGKTKAGVQRVEDGDEDDEELGDDDDDDHDDEEEEEVSGSEDEESGSDSGPDLARGQGNVETSSDEDDDDDDDDVENILRQEEEEIQHDWGELCKDALRSDQVSTRLAVCNMDWDRIRAKDLLVLFSSFVPKGGAVLSVKVYPSEFGKDRLKMEASQGPQELRALPEDSEDDTEEDR
ncbi:ESF1 homolog [Austrofundulus limnaeus]|uniref:ESF1 homolog n=1 Tax=Austrofundulus limnaeus TaxID=52670 RepID=A0A2I4D6K3_AUSLI|nr:PREDICTED: ESF1 homolog [Austrofundulus limnaeus]